MTDSGNSAAPGGNILESRTPIFGQKLDVIIFVTVVMALAVFLVIFLYLRDRRSKQRAVGGGKSPGHLPFVCKESKYAEEDRQLRAPAADGSRNKVFLMGDVVKGIFSDTESKMGSSDSKDSSSLALSASTDGLGSFYWGRWYSLTELQMATDHFSGENVVGEGGYGIVYRGVLPDGTVVAVKHLLNKKGQAEKDLKVEVDAIGKVKHKNLVSLIGYCVEGTHRLLVYEYVDNGNLEQWLHGEVGPVSPLTWEIRMRIAVGTARGLAYLHEGLEPKVVHRDVKSSNILLDRKWNPKVSDFGLAKLLGSEISFVTTRVMGTFGYVSPDYASTGMLNEGNDVYSFGVLLMEIITGRKPVDYAKPPGEMNLVDWFKGMVAGRRVEELVDPLMDVPPSTRALTRILLICLRCVDFDARKRPKMGQIVNMLEGDEFPHRAEIRPFREASHLHPMLLEDDNKMQKAVMNDGGGRYMERMMIHG